ncbi:MAG: undecaprenyldiphospho-muramoylpentapeptide beta-N-acetylglucosaminyltransferase [Candidatus Omnitrophota bacterium]|nr:undecaprenyldiphospho-muramoylpentapeptide beta-N-acetylglucosaminyltransferase [Candidatus Omnitrophota bacterium]
MRVLIVTGSSGGHIFPAIALSDSLKNSGQEVLLVLPQKSRKDKIPIAPGQIKYIPAAVLNFNLSSKNILGLWFFLWGAWESLRIIIKFKPDVVVGFGSLNTLALIFWAWLFRIKTIIHEQNVICGRANRLLAKLVDRVAVSFSQTRDGLNIAGEKIVLTGNPLRRDLVRLDKKEALDFFKFKEGKFTILITGGSQGSHRLNAVCLEVLSAHQKKDDLQVIHISGTQDFSWLAAGYASSTLTYKLFDFLSQMQYAYSLADLIICRAGATTIAELQKFRIPAILIPYPFVYAHQLANAQVLENLKAALIIHDQELTPDKLRGKFTELLADPQKLESMRQAYTQLQVFDATQLLAKEVLTSGCKGCYV